MASWTDEETLKLIEVWSEEAYKQCLKAARETGMCSARCLINGFISQVFNLQLNTEELVSLNECGILHCKVKHLQLFSYKLKN